MNIPGSNLLSTALTIIAKQTVEYFKFINRTTAATGNLVPNYEDPVLISGSLQPVPRAFYTKYGLDFAKTYFTFYTSSDIITTTRDVAGDKIEFDGKTYTCESDNDWFAVDGWTGVLCVLNT